MRTRGLRGTLAADELMPGQHAQHGAGPAAAAADPAVAAYRAALERMHRAMAIAFSGDPDVDFARGMIPHHQGAIDMAQVLLQYGTAPAGRALAEGIIKAREQEIAFLRGWLARQARAG